MSVSRLPTPHYLIDKSRLLPNLEKMAWLRQTSGAKSLLALASQVVAAQTPAARVADGVLTLDEAIAAARRNNPSFLQTLNDRRLADAQVKNARFSLLPSVSSSFGAEYNQGGEQFFGGALISSSSDAVSSSYSLGVNYSVNGATLMAPRAARAQRDAVEADIEGTSEQLRAQVTQQYLTVLQAQARAAVQGGEEGVVTQDLSPPLLPLRQVQVVHRRDVVEQFKERDRLHLVSELQAGRAPDVGRANRRGFAVRAAAGCAICGAMDGWRPRRLRLLRQPPRDLRAGRADDLRLRQLGCA